MFARSKPRIDGLVSTGSAPAGQSRVEVGRIGNLASVSSFRAYSAARL
jgi:hypothetical protein